MGLLSPGQGVWEEAPCEVGQGHHVLSALAGPSRLPPFQSGAIFSVPSRAVSLTKPRGDLDRQGDRLGATGEQSFLGYSALAVHTPLLFSVRFVNRPAAPRRQDHQRRRRREEDQAAWRILQHRTC